MLRSDRPTTVGVSALRLVEVGQTKFQHPVRVDVEPCNVEIVARHVVLLIQAVFA